MNNDIINLSKEINELLKNNPLVIEYNNLYNFLNKDSYFLNKQKELLALKEKIKINHDLYIDEFNKVSNDIKSYPPYINYLEIKKELNDLFNEISNILKIK